VHTRAPDAALAGCQRTVVLVPRADVRAGASEGQAIVSSRRRACASARARRQVSGHPGRACAGITRPRRYGSGVPSGRLGEQDLDPLSACLSDAWQPRVSSMPRSNCFKASSSGRSPCSSFSTPPRARRAALFEIDRLAFLGVPMLSEAASLAQGWGRVNAGRYGRETAISGQSESPMDDRSDSVDSFTEQIYIGGSVRQSRKHPCRVGEAPFLRYP